MKRPEIGYVIDNCINGSLMYAIETYPVDLLL